MIDHFHIGFDVIRKQGFDNKLNESMLNVIQT